MRDGFESYRRQTGRPHPESLSPFQFPEEGRYLLDWFYQIARGRPVTEGSLLPIPAREILAWCQLTQIRLQSWELQAIVMLDQSYLEVVREAVVKDNG